jgi:hypothetical protein
VGGNLLEFVPKETSFVLYAGLTGIWFRPGQTLASKPYQIRNNPSSNGRTNRKSPKQLQGEKLEGDAGTARARHRKRLFVETTSRGSSVPLLDSIPNNRPSNNSAEGLELCGKPHRLGHGQRAGQTSGSVKLTGLFNRRSRTNRTYILALLRNAH